MEAATPIGRSYLDQGYKIEFFSENKQIIAKIYQKNESLVGNCILDNPSDEANCTYESLTEFAKSKIDSLLNNHKALLQPRKLTSEANQEVNTDIKCLSQSVFVPCISPLSIVPPFDPFFDENTMRSKILEFFEDLKRNGKIITNNELKNGNYFSWKGKTNFTRLVGREYLASLLSKVWD
ncbi:MAG: hypothetical protein KDK76_02540 [Chlamydiia bacterium]|nr:hypothetical protein [Chlamydiia bacterium]